MPDVEAVVFDLDGTLIDSAPGIARAVNLVLADCGEAPLSLERVTSFIGAGVPKLISRVIGARGLGEDANRGGCLEAAFFSHYSGVTLEDTLPFDEVEACLDALRARGIRLGLCTNKPERATGVVFDLLGWRERFDTVVCGDTYDCKKPDPLPLVRSFERLQTDLSKGLYVGDSEIDSVTAQGARVRFAHHAQGYFRLPLESIACDFRFRDYGSLRDFVLGAPSPRA